MNSTATRTERTAPQQLTLLSETPTRHELADSKAPVQFRLSKTTRQRGLAHVAEIRQQLAEAQARREAAASQPLPTRTPKAA
ncbi:MAG: hypothetical protein AB8G14_06285 [Ilumatobacter sp.]